METIQRESPLCKSLWLLFASVLFAIPQAHAVTVPDLYEVMVPVMTTRDAAFADAMKVVLIRVSGRRDAAERAGAALADPRKYLQRFGFPSPNILQAAFDGRAVDKLLSDAGLPIWGRERPATLVLLGFEAADGTLQWMDNITPGAEREALTVMAKQRGVPLVWPQMDAQDRIYASEIAASPAVPTMMQAAERYGANAVLFGRARRDGAGGAYVQWILASSGSSEELRGSLDDGINLAADSFARMYAASGSALDSVALAVSGIGNLNDYASALNYLEKMTVVRSVALEQVAGDTLHLKLAVRGDASQLKRALALDNKLVPTSDIGDGVSGQPGQRLQFRYQP